MNESNTNIDKAYEKLLNLGEKISNNDLSEKLTDEIINIAKGSNIDMSEIDPDYNDQKKDNFIGSIDIPDNVMNTKETVLRELDPNGVMGDIIPLKSSVSEFAEKQYNNFEHSDLTNINSIKDFLKDQEDGISDVDTSLIANQMIRRMNGETTGFYENLPTSMQNMVSNIIASANAENIKEAKKINKNQIARGLIDEFINSFKQDLSMNMDLDSMLMEFDEETKKVNIEMGKDAADIMMTYDEEYRANIDAKIKKATEDNKPEVVEKLKEVKQSFEDAFNLEKFIEFCKTCKIKKIEIEKPDREFSHFNSKYSKHENTINDIRACPNILKHHLTEFNEDQCKMVCVAFCKYATDMSPDNMLEHTFMYYFIRNIIMLHRINPTGNNNYDLIEDKFKTFYISFKEAICKALNNLLERNPRFKSNK